MAVPSCLVSLPAYAFVGKQRLDMQGQQRLKWNPPRVGWVESARPTTLLIRQRTIVGQAFQPDGIRPIYGKLGGPVRLESLTYVDFRYGALSK